MSTDDTEKKPLNLIFDENTTRKEAFAAFILTPELESASTINNYHILGKDKYADDVVLMESLRKQIDQAADNDLRDGERMLMGQVYTLHTMFNNLAKRANGCSRLSQFEAYAKMALKAQSQSRSTLLALSEIKNPRGATFVKQANIANNQQVNNAVNIPARENIQNAPSKLSEEPPRELRQDAGNQSQAIRSHTALEAVGAKQRPKDTGGKSKGK